MLRILFAVSVIVVLVVSAGLARFLSVENAERDDERGADPGGGAGATAAMLDRLSGCREQPRVRGRRAGEREPTRACAGPAP